MKFELNAQKRTLQGSGASRRLRRAKKVPGIIYGGNAEPVLIELDHNEVFLSLRKQGFSSSVLSINLEGTKESVLLRDTQVHPYKLQVYHVDFLRVASDQVIQQKVPLRFINGDQAPGVKIAGGTVSHTITELLVSCLPKDLPSAITVDLKDLEAGKAIHVSDIVFPEGVKSAMHGAEDPTVVSIAVKRTGNDTAEVTAAEAAAPAAAAPAA